MRINRVRSCLGISAALVLSLVVFVGATPPPSDEAVPTHAKPFCLCIDPGHPSEANDGSEVTNGLREVTTNWQVALLLRREVQKDGITVVMTKASEAQFVSNKDRAAIANEKHADLLLRLHADAGNSTGFTVYYPRKQGTVHGVTGPSPEVLKSSAIAAATFHQAFGGVLKGSLRDNGLRGDEQTLIGGRQGALTGSIFSKVPTVLVEMVFLTNASDAEWIKQDSNKLLMASALAAGVRAVRDGR